MSTTDNLIVLGVLGALLAVAIGAIVFRKRLGLEVGTPMDALSSSDQLVVKLICAVVMLPVVLLAMFFGRKERLTPEQEAEVERALRPLLGEQMTRDDNAWVGERNGRRAQVPMGLGRIYYEVGELVPQLARTPDVRFKDDGSIRRGHATVAAMSPAAQEAVGTLGRLGCTEVAVKPWGELMVQMPYGQTPEEFAASIADFAAAGDVIARAISVARLEPSAASPGEPAGIGRGERPGSVGPPRS